MWLFLDPSLFLFTETGPTQAGAKGQEGSKGKRYRPYYWTNLHHKAEDTGSVWTFSLLNSLLCGPCRKKRLWMIRRRTRKPRRRRRTQRQRQTRKTTLRTERPRPTRWADSTTRKKFLTEGEVGCFRLYVYNNRVKMVQSFELGLSALSHRWRQPPRRPRRRPSPSSTTAQASSSSTNPSLPLNPQPASQPPQVSHMVSLQGVLLTEEYFYQWFYKYPYRFLAQKAKLIMERLADLQWSYQVSASKMNTLKSFLNGISWLLKACVV